MTSLRRFLPSVAHLRLPAVRQLVLALVPVASLLAALSLSVTPADAVVAKVETSPGVTTTVGLQPREVSRYWEGLYKWNGNGKVEGETNPPAVTFANDPTNLSHPGPVLHSVDTYAIYWDPQDYYHGDWQGLIDGFLSNLGLGGGQTDNLFAVDTQYSDKTNQPATSHSTFHGAYTDTNPYPEAENCTDPDAWEFGVPLLEAGGSVCLTDVQIRSQLQTFIAQHGLEKGMGTIFYLLTPPGVTVCLDAGGATGHCSDHSGSIAEETTSYKNSFCSYHSAINPGSPENGSANTILYGTIPWTAGGDGDNHLTKAENTPAYDCQDGGFEPSSKPNGELEEKEKVKALTPKEKEEFEKKDQQEKREQEEAETLGLQAPHDEEPNQLGADRSPDGSFDTGLADLIVNQVATEQQDIITDPLLNAWHDEAGNEVSDECRNSFFPTSGSVTANPQTKAGTLFNQTLGGSDYYLNDAFNLASLGLPYPGVPCMKGIDLEPKFTAPDPVKSGEVVGFNGMESDITLNSAFSFPASGSPKITYATYKWNFGDGSPEVTGYAPGAPSANSPATSPCEEPWLTPCAASTFHTYQYGGTYEVTLTVTDVGGNKATTMNKITVEGPAAPSGSGGSGSGGSSGGSGSSSSASSSTSSSSSSSTTTGSATPGVAAKPPVPNPVAAAATVSKSLAQVLRSGLVVRYSVNEQVAGRFEVLLASSIAKRIGLHGAPATGLPQGTAPQIVIAKAILVTTKGGRSTIKILFGKTTAARLRKLGKVSLMLRMIVRNASSQSPTSTTVISTVKLGR